MVVCHFTSVLFLLPCLKTLMFVCPSLVNISLRSLFLSILLLILMIAAFDMESFQVYLIQFKVTTSSPSEPIQFYSPDIGLASLLLK